MIGTVLGNRYEILEEIGYFIDFARGDYGGC